MYEDWRVDIGIPRGAYSDDDGILARQYSDGLVLVAPDDGAGGSYMLPRPIYTPDGDVLRGLVELDPGGGLILSNVEDARNGAMSLPVVTPDSPYLDWRGATLITSGSGSPYLSLEDQGLVGEHDILLDAVRSLDPYRIIEARVKISSGSAMLFIAEVDDPDDADMWIIVEVAVSDY